MAVDLAPHHEAPVHPARRHHVALRRHDGAADCDIADGAVDHGLQLVAGGIGDEKGDEHAAADGNGLDPVSPMAAEALDDGSRQEQAEAAEGEKAGSLHGRERPDGILGEQADQESGHEEEEARAANSKRVGPKTGPAFRI